MRAGVIHSDRILRELDDLWVALGGPSDGENREEVLRACAMTLLVLTSGPAGDPALAETLAALMRDHPSRAIVIGVAGDTERRLSADVTARCWMPFGRGQQICSEQIEITATAGALADLPPLILALTAADLPVVAWVRTTRLLAEDSLLPLFRLAGKVILDSAAEPDFPVLLHRIRRLSAVVETVADLSWTRLTRWRSAIADVYDETLQRIRIFHHGPVPPPSALYLAAWLENAVGEGLSVSFASHPDASANDDIREVTLEGPDRQISVSRTAVPPVPERGLLAEELSLLERDPIFEAALERVLA
jgi:hypothetical protein